MKKKTTNGIASDSTNYRKPGSMSPTGERVRETVSLPGRGIVGYKIERSPAKKSANTFQAPKAKGGRVKPSKKR